jgi:hypothetical protein
MDVLAEATLGDPGAPVLEGHTALLGGVVVSARIESFLGKMARGRRWSRRSRWGCTRVC